LPVAVSFLLFLCVCVGGSVVASVRPHTARSLQVYKGSVDNKVRRMHVFLFNDLVLLCRPTTNLLKKHVKWKCSAALDLNEARPQMQPQTDRALRRCVVVIAGAFLSLT